MKKRITGYQWVTQTNAFKQFESQYEADELLEFIEGLKILASEQGITNATALDQYLVTQKADDWKDLERRL